MRYYYSCPLSAAYMSKKFGMVFADGAHSFDVHVISAGIDTPRIYGIEEGWGDKIYIHPDSVHLLEPQKHDLVDFGLIHPCGQSFHELSLLSASFEKFCEESTCDYDSHRIIQRNGIPFHWPEVEA